MMAHFRGSLGMPFQCRSAQFIDQENRGGWWRKASPIHILRFNARKDREPQVVYFSYWFNEDFEPIPIWTHTSSRVHWIALWIYVIWYWQNKNTHLFLPSHLRIYEVNTAWTGGLVGWLVTVSADTIRGWSCETRSPLVIKHGDQTWWSNMITSFDEFPMFFF